MLIMKKRGKVFIQTQGGLGNQLFQFNFAHQLTELFKDYTVYLIDGSIGTDRKFALEGAMDTCTHLSKNWRATNMGKYYLRLLYGLKRRWPHFKFFNYALLAPESAFLDPTLFVSKMIECKSRVLYVRGDFINNRFPVSQCLIHSIQNLESESTGNKEYHDVVVHIRRGDYLIHQNYGPLSLEYFEKILNHFPIEYNVLVHTDDGEYVSQNLKTKQRISVVGKEASPFELLKDSQRALYFVGSNSTLSWWAATLFQLGSKADPSGVLMPQLWFRNQTMVNHNLVSQGWSLFDPIWDK